MNIINFSLARGTGPSGPAGGRRYQPPALPADLVARSGLIARLDGPPGRICVVHGPPGSGKSVLLASHHAQLQAQGLAVQWLNLTSEDNRPEVLRRHLARRSRVAAWSRWLMNRVNFPAAAWPISTTWSA